MSKYDKYDAVISSTKSNKKPWEMIEDGEHTVVLKKLEEDENEKGPWLDFEYYYPEFNASERERVFLSDNEFLMSKLQAKLVKINPKFASLSRDLEATKLLAKNGTAVIKRETNVAKNGKSYANYSIVSFTPESVPF